MTPRSQIFSLLDALIANGYGDVPQTRIPENWRDIPREVNDQDRERVRHEELGDPRTLIREVEESNRAANPELIAQLFANAKARRSRRVGQHKEWRDRIAWREAAMRARRTA